MRPRDLVLGVLVAVVWGVAFVATKLALHSFSPPQLAALRFLIAALPALFLARPLLPWSILVPIGLTLFAGQFLFQFFGIAHGMPPGLASVAVQTQAFFTVAIAGLLVIAATVGDDLTAIGFALTMLSAVSWGVGNVLLKRAPSVDMLRLMVWL